MIQGRPGKTGAAFLLFDFPTMICYDMGSPGAQMIRETMAGRPERKETSHDKKTEKQDQLG